MSKNKAKIFLPWDKLSDDSLLQHRVRDLGLKIEGTVLEGRIEKLHLEMQGMGLRFKPPCYLADEWLCPDRVPIIGIPFYLAHPRLISLEKKMMLEAEGATESWCMKLLRHEAGHAVNYAYRLFQRRSWREKFGDFNTPYYDVTYPMKPYSKRFVTHLEDNYAQAHPDEDFAETFAVWLTPGEEWRQRYRGWPALEKIEFVDALMREIGQREPLVKSTQTPWSSARMNSTLSEFYARKQKFLGAGFAGFYDPGLKRLFAPPGEGSPPEKAAPFLRRHRKALVEGIARFVPQRKFDIDHLMEKFIARTRALDLRLKGSPEQALLQTSAFATAVCAFQKPFNGVHEVK